MLVLLSLLLTLPCAAEELDGKELWGGFLDGLPDLVRDRMPENGDSESVGELVGIKSLLALLGESTVEGVREVLPFLSSLLGIVLIGAAAELLRTQGGGVGTRRAAGAAISATLATLIWQYASVGVSSLMSLLSDMQSVMTGAIPALTAVYVAAGHGGTAAVGATALSAGIALTETVAAGVLPTVAGCSFGFALVGSLGGEMKLDGIAKSLRGLFMTVLGLISFVLTCSLALQKSLTSAADSAAMRGAKYAVGTMIPIVGGTISSVLGTLAGSLTLLKKTVGVGAVAALLLLALPTLLYLLLARFSFSIAGAVAHLFGVTSIEKLLGEFRGIYDMLLAVGAICTVMFLVSLALLVGGTVGVAA